MIKKEHIAAKVFKGLTWHFTGKDNELFLTFDDGPTPEITPWVLDILKEYDARATFFCLGQNVERYPEIFNRIKDEGHSVGNHTYSHPKGWFLTNRSYYRNINRAAQLIHSNIYRPPYGKIKPSQIATLKRHYNIVMWSILPRDYNPKVSREKCLQNILDYAESGSIILLHDTLKAEKNLKYVLPILLEEYSKQGYTFNSISFEQ